MILWAEIWGIFGICVLAICWFAVEAATAESEEAASREARLEAASRAAEADRIARALERIASSVAMPGGGINVG